jgi:hypothetical protein
MTEQPDADAEATDRDAELAALTEEITSRIHAGEEIDLDDYARRYPKLAGSTRRLLPTLHRLAELGRPRPAATTPDETSSRSS